MPIRGKLLLFGAPVLLILLAVTELGTGGFVDALRMGALIGIALVVLVLYPAVLHQHERRLAALEGRGERQPPGPVP